MNIFYLDNDPEQCAKYHCDKHCVKMVLEYAQLLSSAHHVLDHSSLPNLYKLTHKNHPCAIWTRQSNNNYNWLYTLFHALCKEYTYRYGKIHKTEEKLLEVLRVPPMNIPIDYFREPPQAMPDDIKSLTSSIEGYRMYYKTHKRELCVWKNREIPEWFGS